MTSEALTRTELKTLVHEIDRCGDQAWLDHVEERKVLEAKFHDDKVDRHGLARDSENLQERKRGNQKYYSTVARSKQYVEDWIARNSQGRVVLDYACGQGKLTMLAAKSGAELAVGLDISETSILNARADANEDGYEHNTSFFQGDCEATQLPDNSVDVILCSGMLHHLDVAEAFPEMHRILKPGGVCLAVEALDYNPIVKAYRLLTPKLRTEWEKHHILSHAELKLAENYFDVENVKYWHLCSIAAAGLRKTPLFRPALALGNLLDSVLMRIPPIKYMAWQFTFELRKPIAAVEPKEVRHAAAA